MKIGENAILDPTARQQVEYLWHGMEMMRFEEDRTEKRITKTREDWSKNPALASHQASMIRNLDARISAHFRKKKESVPAKISAALQPPALTAQTIAMQTAAYSKGDSDALVAEMSALRMSPAVQAPAVATYRPSKRARELLEHYEAHTNAFEPLANRIPFVLIQEQKPGTPAWQDSLDAAYVIGTIILDQQPNGSVLFLKHFKDKNNEYVNITSKESLLEKLGRKTKFAAKQPAFSTNFREAFTKYLREHDENFKKNGTEIDPGSIYLIGTGADDTDSEKAIKEIVQNLNSKKLAPKQLCVAMICVGENPDGEANLAALDALGDKTLRNIMDTSHFSKIDCDELVQYADDSDGVEVETDLLEKLTMGLFTQKSN